MLNLSIYSHDYDLKYLKEAKQLGIKNVFISLHIPEFINDKVKVEMFLKDISTFNFNITADVSTTTFEVFSKEELKSYGINKLRIDYGFSEDEIINLSQEFKIVLNASTLTFEQLEYFDGKLNLSEIEAMHNFYPKVETGLSKKQLITKNKMLKQYNMKTSGFIHGDLKPRGPLFKGLVTLEEHRHLPPHVAYLLLKEMCDYVYVGDIKISVNEMEKILLIESGVIPIMIKTSNDYLLSLVNKNLTIRLDSNDINLRIYESRTDFKLSEVVEPMNNIKRRKGYITLDNKLNLRYMGEVMICLKDMECSEVLNVVGEVINTEILDFDLCGKTIKFEIVKKNNIDVVVNKAKLPT